MNGKHGPAPGQPQRRIKDVPCYMLNVRPAFSSRMDISQHLPHIEFREGDAQCMNRYLPVYKGRQLVEDLFNAKKTTRLPE